MHIDEIQNGIVIDHIKAGKGMELYHFLHLDELDCSVAILRNVNSQKMGKKDIIKIDSVLNMVWAYWLHGPRHDHQHHSGRQTGKEIPS